MGDELAEPRMSECGKFLLDFIPWEGEQPKYEELVKLLDEEGVEFTDATFGPNGKEGMLRKFLRARSLDIDKAATMLKNCVEWRKENDVDTIWDRAIEEPKVEVIGKTFKSYFAGYDREGHIVYYENTGGVDFETLFSQVSLDTMLHAHKQLQEFQNKVMYRRASERAGRLKTRGSNVVDMRGLSLWMLTSQIKDLISKVSDINQNNYPEGLYKCYIINAPWAFTAVFAFVKPFLNENTVKKINILGSGPQMYKELIEALGEDCELTEEMLCGEKLPEDMPMDSAHKMCQDFIRERLLSKK